MRILFQGDSITDGGRLKPAESRWDLNHQIGHCYVYPIAGELGMKKPGAYQFINRGVSASTTTSLLERWQTDTLDEHPDMLSILIGINGNYKFDGHYPEGAEANLANFEREYRALLDTAREQNPALKLVLMEPFALPVGSLEPHYEAFMAVFRRRQAIIRRLAEEYGAVFVPLQEPLEKLVAESAPVLAAEGYEKSPCAYWMWDGVHPTEPWHYAIARLWLEACKDIL